MARAKKQPSTEKQQAIEERRWKVWRLRVVHKLDISEIVKQVKVARSTVEADLAVMRQSRREHIRLAVKEQNAALDATIEVIEECEAARRQAWSDLLATEAGGGRAKFLSILLSAISKEIEIRQSLGLLDRAAEELIVRDTEMLREVLDLFREFVNPEQWDAALARLDEIEKRHYETQAS